jgi:hypothetical protein
MADINGSYRHADRPMVYFTAKLDGERWECTAKVGGEVFMETTWAPSPWPTLERMVASALDHTNMPTEPPKWDLNRKFKQPTPLRRRRLPTGLPEWRPPETD